METATQEITPVAEVIVDEPKKNNKFDFRGWVKLFLAILYMVVWLVATIASNLMLSAAANLFADFGASLPMVTSFLFNQRLWLGIISFVLTLLVSIYLVFSANRRFKNQTLVDLAVIITSISVGILFIVLTGIAVYLPISQLSTL